MDTISQIAPYLIAVSVLVGLSAFFSGTEVALFSLRRVDRETMQRSTRRSDRLVTALIAKPQRLIATVLIGNECVNVSVSTVMASLAPILFPGRSNLELALLATALALPALLFFGEITPKTIAMQISVGWARFASRPIWLFGILVTPLRWIVRAVASVILWPMGGLKPRGNAKDMSEAEFRTLVDAGSAEGHIDARERRMIHRVFEFGDKTVGQVMTGRNRIFALSYDLPMARLMREIAERGYSRVPIYQKSLDNVRGVLHAKDLVVQGTGLSRPRILTELLHEVIYVPRNLSIKRLFQTFKTRKVHMALVVDEYGKLVGLITMDDVLAQLFGDIRDERELQKQSKRGAVRPPTEPGNTVAAVVAGDPGRAAEATPIPRTEPANGHSAAGEGEST